MRENKYQAALIKKLKIRFPDCLVLINDPTQIQGIPDLTILWRKRWAMLEVKVSKDAPRRPNQEHYVELCKTMLSYAAFIYPENEEEILRELERAFEAGW